MNQTITDILNRRSVRAFRPQQLTNAQLEEILLCGRFAASARNSQKWHFTVIQNKEFLDEIVEGCKEGMRQTGDIELINRANDPAAHNFFHAPAVIIVSSEEQYGFGEADCANAVQNMAVAAWSLGIGSCYIANFRFAFASDKAPAILEKLALPQGYKPQFALALGYAVQTDIPAPERNGNVVNYIR